MNPLQALKQKLLKSRQGATHQQAPQPQPQVKQEQISQEIPAKNMNQPERQIQLAKKQKQQQPQIVNDKLAEMRKKMMSLLKTVSSNSNQNSKIIQNINQGIELKQELVQAEKQGQRQEKASVSQVMQVKNQEKVNENSVNVLKNEYFVEEKEQYPEIKGNSQVNNEIQSISMIVEPSNTIMNDMFSQDLAEIQVSVKQQLMINQISQNHQQNEELNLNYLNRGNVQSNLSDKQILQRQSQLQKQIQEVIINEQMSINPIKDQNYQGKIIQQQKNVEVVQPLIQNENIQDEGQRKRKLLLEKLKMIKNNNEPIAKSNSPNKQANDSNLKQSSESNPENAPNKMAMFLLKLTQAKAVNIQKSHQQVPQESIRQQQSIQEEQDQNLSEEQSEESQRLELSNSKFNAQQQSLKHIQQQQMQEKLSFSKQQQKSNKVLLKQIAKISRVTKELRNILSVKYNENVDKVFRAQNLKAIFEQIKTKLIH